jgi:hypothetical protein
MTQNTAQQYLLGTFTTAERQFLFAQPEFQKVLAQSTEALADLKKLNALGVKLLLTGEYQPPAAQERRAEAA